MYNMISKIYTNFRIKNKKLTRYYQVMFGLFKIGFRLRRYLQGNYGQIRPIDLKDYTPIPRNEIRRGFKKEMAHRQNQRIKL